MFGQKMLGSKIFWSRKLLVEKFRSKTNFDEKKLPTKFFVTEKFGQKHFGQKNSLLKKLFVKKKCLFKKMFG